MRTGPEGIGVYRDTLPTPELPGIRAANFERFVSSRKVADGEGITAIRFGCQGGRPPEINPGENRAVRRDRSCRSIIVNSATIGIGIPSRTSRFRQTIGVLDKEVCLVGGECTTATHGGKGIAVCGNVG